MANESQKQQQKPDRKRDTEALAAGIFASLAVSAFARAKTPESIAAEALSLARAFYRACDEPEPKSEVRSEVKTESATEPKPVARTAPLG